VEELYDENNRREADMGDLVTEVYNISAEEIRDTIKELPKRKLAVKIIFLQSYFNAWERKD